MLKRIMVIAGIKVTLLRVINERGQLRQSCVECVSQSREKSQQIFQDSRVPADSYRVNRQRCVSVHRDKSDGRPPSEM